MKVGILTQHFHKNYGGILQNWALQQVLLQMGHDPLTFEHDTCYSRLRWLLRSAKQVCKRNSFASLPTYPYKGRVGHKPFINFIVKNIRSVTVHTFTPEIERRHKCGAFIVGSDQVWRPAFNLGRLYNMYLDFASNHVRKISYAASFGVTEWEYTADETKRCRELAEQFDAISVREDSAISLCREYLGVEAKCVLDPTLLLNKEEYMSLCKDVVICNHFIFVYALHLNDKILSFANELAIEKQLDVKVLLAGDALQPDDSIQQWIAMFRDADYVVTDSFHGMAFSIIFNKTFYIFKNESGGVARYYSLLNMLGLDDRIVDDKVKSSPNDIDWEIANKKLEEMKQKSLQFLKDSLS